MGGLLFLSDLCMLYSTSPHEKFTMMAHAGKLLAYLLLHVIQMRVAAADSRARGVAEVALLRKRESLQLALDDLQQQKFALGTSEAYLRTVLATIPDLVWLKDTAGVYLFCNTRFERLYGAREKDIVGKTDYDFVSRELADSFREHDRKAALAGKPTVNDVFNDN